MKKSTIKSPSLITSISNNASGTFVLLLMLGFIMSLYIQLIPTFPAIYSNKFSQNNLASLLTNALFASLIVERSLEVFISVWRHGAKTRIENEIYELKQSISKYSPEDYQEKKIALKLKLYRYQRETESNALLLGFIIGIFVSLVGVRVLEPLVDLAQAPQPQQLMFRILDIILTGSAISGGSNAFHSLISVFTDFLELSRPKTISPSSSANDPQKAE